MTTKADTTKTKVRGVKMASLPKQDQSDLPEYVKAEELQTRRPFTIFGGNRNRGRYGERINFNVAWKEGETVVKRVWTASENEQRLDLLTVVKRESAVTNCRVVRLHLGGGQTYWKVIDNDEPVPEEAQAEPADVKDDQIPF